MTHPDITLTCGSDIAAALADADLVGALCTGDEYWLRCGRAAAMIERPDYEPTEWAISGPDEDLEEALGAAIMAVIESVPGWEPEWIESEIEACHRAAALEGYYSDITEPEPWEPTEGDVASVAGALCRALGKWERKAILREWGRMGRRAEDRCECGHYTGGECGRVHIGSDGVAADVMPDHLRASHEAAGNVGTYPHNGALRLRLHRDCAADLAAESPEWVEIH